VEADTYDPVAMTPLRTGQRYTTLSLVPAAVCLSYFTWWLMIVLYNVFIPTRNAVDLSMHVSNKEHTNT